MLLSCVFFRAVLLARGKHDGGIGIETHVWCDRLESWTRLKKLPLLQLLQVEVAGSAASLNAPPGGLPPEARDAQRRQQRQLLNQEIQNSSSKNKISSFLGGWLQRRTPPREMVQRGLLQNEPLRRRDSGATAASHEDEIFNVDVTRVLERTDTDAAGIPRVVNVLMQRLRDNNDEGLRSEGIFRVSGDAEEIVELRERINRGADPAEAIKNCHNLNSVAGLLKRFYREMKPPLLTFGLYDDLVAFSARTGAPAEDEAFDPSEIIGLLSRLPPGHLALLKNLIEFLTEMVQYTGESKMTVGNTAAVFAPNLLRPEMETLEHLADTAHTVNLIQLFIHRCAAILGPRAVPPPVAVAGGGAEAGLSHAMARVSMGGTPASVEQGRASFHSPSAGVSQPPELEPVVPDVAGRDWYWLSPDLQQQGPASWAQLQASMASGRIDGGTYIFAEGMGDWALASDLNVSSASEPRDPRTK